MRGNFVKYIAFALALVLALSGLCLFPVGAQDTQDYFVFEYLTDANEKEYFPQGAALSLPLGTDGSFTASDISLVSKENNAFYVSFQNLSNATKLRISYTYKVQGGSDTEVLEKNILPHAADQTMTLYASHLGPEIENLQISFSANETLNGSVELNAFFDISTYATDEQEDITLSRCHYTENELQIQGSLSYAATVRYEGGTLALFSLGEGEDLHLSGKTPIARTDVSFHFSFAVSVSRADELFRRYVVAAITAEGERVPLCVPTYPSLQTVEASPEQGFKGYHSLDFSRVMDNIPELGVVDVYLDQLFGTQSDGILYAGEYDYYYFDQSYVADVERRIHNLAGVGASVYLRFLVGNSRDNLSFADDAPIDVTNRLAVIRNEAAQRDLYAAIDFITSRLKKQNGISGLILGRSADLVSQYSYCNAATLAQYSALYASTLNLVAGVARRNIPTLRMLVPVSDAVWAKSATSLKEDNDFYTELFLPSLLNALEEQILEPQSFGIMLENAVFSDRVGGEDLAYYGVDRLPQFLTELEHLALTHSYLSSDILFSWQPNGEEEAAKLHADYLWKYAQLSQNARVYAFLLDFSVAEERGEESGVQSLDHLAKYINTERLPNAATLALTTLEEPSLEALYNGAEKWQQKRVYQTELTKNGYLNTSTAKGSFALWSFSSADDTLEWYEGTACRSFFVSSANQATHALVAQFSTGGAYGEIAYHFDAPVDLSFAPLWVMPISIGGKQGARYELQIRLIGENTVTYASAVVDDGVSEQLYLDLSAAPSALSDLRAIRLMARPLDGETEDFTLYFGGMTVQSTTLSDKDLSERVNEIWHSTLENDTDIPVRDYKIPLLITAIVVVVSVGVSVFLILDHKRRKKRNKSDLKER